MSSKYFKEYLQHAWTNTPSSVISDYNREYYKKHANDWVVRKNKRLNSALSTTTAGSVPKITNTSNSTTKSNSGWKGPDLEYGGEKLYDIVHATSSVIKTTINAGKRFIDSIIDWRKDVHIRRQDKGSTIGGMIKSGLKWIKDNFGF